MSTKPEIIFYAQKIEYNRAFIYALFITFLITLIAVYFNQHFGSAQKPIICSIAALAFYFLGSKLLLKHKEIILLFDENEIISKEESGALLPFNYEKLEAVYVDKYDRLVMAFGGRLLTLKPSTTNEESNIVNSYEIQYFLENKISKIGTNTNFKKKCLVAKELSERSSRWSVVFAIVIFLV